MRISILSLLGFILLFSCSSPARRTYESANELRYEQLEKPFLKAHFKDGKVAVFGSMWEYDSVANTISGTASLYDFNRDRVSKGFHKFSLDAISLFETNKPVPKSGRIAALAIFTAANVAVTTMCITTPKACYGSCPTFYLNEEDNFHYADAEGFSSAILPSFAYSDIDALSPEKLHRNSVNLIMKNEALETHVVDQISVLGIKAEKNTMVWQSTSSRFYRTGKIYSAHTADEIITQDLLKPDRKEWFAASNPDNMKSQKELVLSFNIGDEAVKTGLAVHFRQSLMTTYLIYSAMGYMGDEVGEILTKLETSKDGHSNLKKGLFEELGKLEISVWDAQSQQWIEQGFLYETGPIAINRQMLPLNAAVKGQVKVKIKYNEGLWRIDYAALTQILGEEQPQHFNLTCASKGRNDILSSQSLINGIDSEKLISMPGDKYVFTFKAPEENTDYHLFLSTHGYYLEWMRESWLKDKDLLMLKNMFEEPAHFLKQMGPDYKRYERDMEEIFWNSKVPTNSEEI